MNSLPVYEFFFALGLVSGSTLLYFLLKRSDAPVFKTTKGYLYFVLGACLAGLWGARALGDIVDASSKKMLSWGSFDLLILDKASGSFVFYGGLLAFLYYLFLIARFKKIPFLRMLDFCIPALALGQALGRLGCWGRGCCFGSSCSYPWGIVREVAQAPIHPVQIYEAAWLFGLAFLSTRKAALPYEKLSSWQKKLPRNSIFYLLAYPSFRFCVEFFRGDEIRGFWGPLSTSQWISIGLFVVGVVLYFRDTQSKRGAASPQL